MSKRRSRRRSKPPLITWSDVRKLVPERIVFEPDPKRRLYTFKGQASYGRLQTGTVYKKNGAPGVDRP